ncbi:hypothetical protein H5410_006523 [Solanum commersonii]|uniref:Uncharacterized protein n=1 Tax=Solanum commersonii TaxID=4109 RepID=A0A9J6AA01_SOLCO|nr:hypothetical protein H5410_006523 [Solanum commersonii]
MRLVVRVPVLSLQMVVADPIVSAGWRDKCFIIHHLFMAKQGLRSQPEEVPQELQQPQCVASMAWTTIRELFDHGSRLLISSPCSSIFIGCLAFFFEASRLLVTTIIHAFVLRDLFPNDIAKLRSANDQNNSKMVSW